VAPIDGVLDTRPNELETRVTKGEVWMLSAADQHLKARTGSVFSLGWRVARTCCGPLAMLVWSG